MADEFNPDAIDGDGDGLVQDGTEWERPVDEAVAEEPAAEEAKVEEPVVEKAAPKKKTSKKTGVDVGDDKVALWSDSNLHHLTWGSLPKGPSIVSKEVADFWSGHRMVRFATPEEVANYYKG